MLTLCDVMSYFIHVLQSKLAADGLHEPLELREGLLDLQPELPLGQVVMGLVLGGQYLYDVCPGRGQGGDNETGVS